MKPDDYETLLNRFRNVFEGKWNRADLENFDELREKFAFHMADVATNFLAIASVYEQPNAIDAKSLSDRTELFFNDCVPHLMAAAQIYDEIPMVFAEQQGVHDWASFVDEGEAALAPLDTPATSALPHSHPAS
jgi:hypothetical protein